MLPYVQFKNDVFNEDAPYCFLPVLYLDSLLAVLGGRIFWEFNKEMARFTTQGYDYGIRHEILPSTYLTSLFSLSGTPVIGQSVSNFEAITPILRLPVIEYGPLGYVSSIYNVEYEDAYIMPFNLDLTNIGSPYLPKGNYQAGTILSEELGSFVMQYQWSLTYAKFIKF